MKRLVRAPYSAITFQTREEKKSCGELTLTNPTNSFGRCELCRRNSRGKGEKRKRKKCVVDFLTEFQCRNHRCVVPSNPWSEFRTFEVVGWRKRQKFISEDLHLAPRSGKGQGMKQPPRKRKRERERMRERGQGSKEINAARSYRGQKGPWEAETISRLDLGVLSRLPRHRPPEKPRRDGWKLTKTTDYVLQDFLNF